MDKAPVTKKLVYTEKEAERATAAEIGIDLDELILSAEPPRLVPEGKDDA